MKINFFILILLLCACSSNVDIPPDERISHEIIQTFVQKMRSKGFHACGIGEGINHNTGKQNYLQLSFDTESLPNVDFARVLLVKTIHDFLYEINSKENFKEYMHDYPFTCKNIAITIFSKNSKTGLVYASNFENQLTYYKKNPNYPEERTNIEVYREPFNEAVCIVQQTDSISWSNEK